MVLFCQKYGSTMYVVSNQTWQCNFQVQVDLPRRSWCVRGKNQPCNSLSQCMLTSQCLLPPSLHQVTFPFAFAFLTAWDWAEASLNLWPSESTFIIVGPTSADSKIGTGWFGSMPTDSPLFVEYVHRPGSCMKVIICSKKKEPLFLKASGIRAFIHPLWSWAPCSQELVKRAAPPNHSSLNEVANALETKQQSQRNRWVHPEYSFTLSVWKFAGTPLFSVCIESETDLKLFLFPLIACSVIHLFLCTLFARHKILSLRWELWR